MIEEELGAAIKQALLIEPGNLERIEKLAPTFDTYLSITRQLGRNIEAQARVATAQRKEADVKAKMLDLNTSTGDMDSRHIGRAPAGRIPPPRPR